MMHAPAEAEELYYRPIGNMRRVWECRDSEMLVEGPAGTGKTRAILEKLHLAATKYAGARFALVRKTRTSMTQSVLVTFDNQVKPGMEYPYFHGGMQEYRYENGSVIVVAGLDKASRVLSSEYDVIFVNEGTELAEAEHEVLKTRLRNGVMPYQQLIVDCNPEADHHWLNRRADAGRITRIVTRHEDNPVYFDADRNEKTQAGIDYIDGILENLTGVRYLRFRKGVWARAEGLIYDIFDRAIHVIQPDKVPRFVRRYRAIDFGYVHPFVCQWWGEDYDGRLYLYREIYHTGRTVNVHARQIINSSKGEEISVTVTDTDAEDRATLEENTIYTTGADKRVTTGIQAVTDRLKVDGSGRPRLFFVEGAVMEVDESLRKRGLPTCTIEEMTSYAWDEEIRPGMTREAPAKQYDHGMDTMRYMVMHLDAEPLEAGAESYTWETSLNYRARPARRR